MTSNNVRLTQAQLSSFKKNGFLVVRGWLTGDALGKLQQLAQQQYRHPTEPWELEAQLGYPGAPLAIEETGGQTIRRLLGACQREPSWRALATGEPLKGCIQRLLNSSDISLSQAHHNCLMTKSPLYSSDTGWHQDSRYWHFKKNELISAWLALGNETAENGALQVVPGSHCENFSPQQFDESTFFIADKYENISFIEQAITLVLNPGDLLFFHCNLLHRASRNLTNTTKLSLVFTYHSSDNTPVGNTRSAAMDEILL
ncbi:phytanoyl-CoA dioxygenase family protein [Teredinibacter franksiae]|uniref:phytanoyl-CoA dioxygenase family protein n=1 Tax=Teredinibacter franksiae TaxID=2761453 RepID=UPI0016249106|nr:phytanoyl-CoA dioxygenase family protein [Teredinibacter franksiae]